MNEKSIAIAIVVRNEDVLMVRRKGSEQLTWQFPSGEIEQGEDAMAAAPREVKEETSVDCVAQDVIGERIHPVTMRHVFYVSCHWEKGTPIVADADELDRAEWVKKSDVPKRVPFGIAPAVQSLLAS